MAWRALRQLLKGKIENEISSLSEMLECKRAQLIDLIRGKNKEKESEERMISLSNVLDTIYKERERILQYKIRSLDARTIIMFLSSSFLSLATILKTLEDVSGNKIVMSAVNNTQIYIDLIINNLHQFLSW